MASSHESLSVRAEHLPEALHRRDNWIQLAEFAAVGTSGYVVNLAAYTVLLKQAKLHYLAAATASFLLAVSWNYWCNRNWTFRAQRGRFGSRGCDSSSSP